jgi:hypothetical protein
VHVLFVNALMANSVNIVLATVSMPATLAGENPGVLDSHMSD